MEIETKTDFAVQLRDSLPHGTTIREAEAMAEAYARAVHLSFKKGASIIRLPNIGTIEVSQRQASMGTNPRTGEPIEIAARRTVKIKPHAQIKRLANLKGITK